MWRRRRGGIWWTIPETNSHFRLWQNRPKQPLKGSRIVITTTTIFRCENVRFRGGGIALIVPKWLDKDKKTSVFVGRFFWAHNLSQKLVKLWRDVRWSLHKTKAASHKPLIFHKNPAEWMNYDPADFLGQKLVVQPCVFCLKRLGKDYYTRDYSKSMSNSLTRPDPW